MATKPVKRRRFIQGLVSSQCLAVMGWPLISSAASQPLSTRITDNITLITGAGGNVVLFQGSQGLTMIDSGSSENVSSLLTLVNSLSGGAPINFLFNTHWHEDHSGGNEAVHATGADIIAHENTKLWLGADFYVEWREWGHTPRSADAFPNTTFYNDGKMDLGGETVQYFHPIQAHTDGDIYLYFPDSNVMVAGGLMTDSKYPISDIATGGWIGGLIKANAAMLSMVDDNTVIIPDRGPVQNKADLQAQHDMLSDLYEQMKELSRLGNSGYNMLEEKLTAKYDSIWGPPEEFVLETYRGMWAHTYDMGGFI